MRRFAWLGLAAVVLIALVIGTTDTKPATAEQRARRIGNTVMCPACHGETVSNSQVPAAVNIRRQITQRIADGRTDQEIRDELAGAYGQQILMNPPKSGIAGLVWVLPVAGLIAALAGLAFAFRRWRVAGGTGLTAEDLAAVERARRDDDGSVG
jgi:cytochrome c-type biogenesis protein CcmH